MVVSCVEAFDMLMTFCRKLTTLTALLHYLTLQNCTTTMVHHLRQLLDYLSYTSLRAFAANFDLLESCGLPQRLACFSFDLIQNLECD